MSRARLRIELPFEEEASAARIGHVADGHLTQSRSPLTAADWRTWLIVITIQLSAERSPYPDAP